MTMKARVAGTLKWNVIDRLGSQVLYAVTGVVLARLLSPADFGLVGAVMVFQAFASILVDSGFSSALIQRKSPTRLDYSTILWFNMLMAVALYVVLWLCAPLIADCFQGDRRLVPLSRVMFLSIIINAASIVQTNRLMKLMDVKMVAVSNGLGLTAGAIVGVWLAVKGCGAWAIVWQTLTLAAVKTLTLWLTGHWSPLWSLSWSRLRTFTSVGFGVMGTSLLNTIFLNVYSFLIGNRAGLASLGYYTQADKWSKMGTSSISQVLTASFLPALSQYQDSPRQFASATAKMNRFTAWLLFPAMGLLAVMATPIFHGLFGTKWDPAIALFVILLGRGVFTVLSGLYANYILALGRSRLLVWSELLRDGAAVVAIILTWGWITVGDEADPCVGLRVFLLGQLAASALSWLALLAIAARLSRRSPLEYVTDCLPYLGLALVACAAAWAVSLAVANPWALMALELTVGLGMYLGLGALTGSKVQRDAIDYLRGRLE